MSELVERLEIAAQWDDSPSQLIHEAIARIEALEAEVARMSSALEPFAREADERKSKGLLGGVIFTQPVLLAARRAREGGNENGQG